MSDIVLGGEEDWEPPPVPEDAFGNVLWIGCMVIAERYKHFVKCEVIGFTEKANPRCRVVESSGTGWQGRVVGEEFVPVHKMRVALVM